MFKCKQSCALSTKEGTKNFELGKTYSAEDLKGIHGSKDYGHFFKGETPYFVEIADTETAPEKEAAPVTSKKEDKKEEEKKEDPRV